METGEVAENREFAVAGDATVEVGDRELRENRDAAVAGEVDADAGEQE